MPPTIRGNLRHALGPSAALLLALVLGHIAGAETQVPTAGPPALTRVLMVNSYEQGAVWPDAVVRGVRETLDAAEVPVEFWFEYLDVHRQSQPDHLSRALDRIRATASRVAFDVVVVSDDAATGLIAEHLDELFPRQRIVAVGVNEAGLIDRYPPGRVTALLEVYDPHFMPALAARLDPSTRRFLVVTDNTRTGASVHQLYRAYAATRTDVAFEFIDGRHTPLEAIVSRLRAAGPGDAILLSNFLRDHEGRHYPRSAAVGRLATEAGAPVYTTVLSSLGQGIMVGLDNRGYRHGVWAGERVLQWLRSPDTPAARVEREPAGRVVADVRALNRWGIDRFRLPADAILINEPASFYRANKRLVWIAVGVALLQTLAVAALAVNVRRRRRAELALRTRTDHLEQTLAALEQARVERLDIEERMRQGERLESMGRLAGGIAHDFNNLLTVILSYAEVSAAAVPPDSELARHMAQIRLAGTSAADLTRQILAFSRRQVLSPALVDVNDLVEESSGLIRRLLATHVDVSLRLQPELPPILIDRTQLQQVLMNLAANAADAMPDGGTLAIETSVADSNGDPAADPTMRSGRHVVVAVSDTGSGMTPEVLERIFDPFFTTKPKGRGTGLGLASVYGTVKQSGGWIWADSQVGRGTAFKIHFPVAAQPAAGRQPTGPHAA